MKDKEVRTSLDYHCWEFHGNKDLSDVSIKDCPKCKHPVLAQRFTNYTRVEPNVNVEWEYYHQCLTCGSAFTCSLKNLIVEESNIASDIK